MRRLALPLSSALGAMKAKCQKCSAEFSLKTEAESCVTCPSCGASLEPPTVEQLKAHVLGLDAPTSGRRIIKLISIYCIFLIGPAYFLLRAGSSYSQYLWPVMLVSVLPLIYIQMQSRGSLESNPILLREKSGT